MGQRSYPQCFPLKTDDRRHTSKPGFWHARIGSMALNYQKTNRRTLEASSSSPGRAKMDLERFPSGLDADNFKNPWNCLKTYLDWISPMSNIKMSHHNWNFVFNIILLDCIETSMIGYIPDEFATNAAKQYQAAFAVTTFLLPKLQVRMWSGRNKGYRSSNTRKR